MRNSEKILKSLSSLIENGILTSKEIRKQISTDLKFTRDKIINKLESKEGKKNPKILVISHLIINHPRCYKFYNFF